MNKNKLLIYLFFLICFSCSTLQTTKSDLKLYSEKNCAIVTGHPEATKIGAEILEKGGNAIDASLATQLALAVCFPRAGNIGGGGFMVYRKSSGEKYTLDFREKAPINSSKNMYLNNENEIVDSLSTYGHLAIAIPGTIDGVFEAHEKFGSLPISEIFEPAIKLAERGFCITEKQAELFNFYKEDFDKYNPNNNYLVKKERWKVGDTLIQKDLAETLKIIKTNGRDSFYNGVLTEKIINQLEGLSIITKEDFKKYKSIWREPITCEIGDYTIIGMPPPSSGGIAICQLLEMTNYLNFEKLKHNSSEYIHLISEMEKLVFSDRAEFLGDPDFENIPILELLDKKYLKSRFENIQLNKATDSSKIKHGELLYSESEETTHFSIIDNEGNAVSVTTTLNTNFGSKVFVNDLGFLLNNEMDDFSSKPGHPNTYGLIGSEANSIKPEKRMLSSMSPTIIEKENKVFLVLGSPGGSTIITSVFQTIMNTINFDMDIQSAVDAPRFHHQWLPDNIYFERNNFLKNTIDSLTELGHKIKERSSMGHVNAILMYPKIATGEDKRGDNKGFELYVPIE